MHLQIIRDFLKDLYHKTDKAVSLYSLYSVGDVIDILTTIEKKLPVETWHCNGIYIWPFLRCYLYGQLCYAQRPSLYHWMRNKIASCVCNIWKSKNKPKNVNKRTTRPNTIPFTQASGILKGFDILLKDNTLVMKGSGESRGIRLLYPVEKLGYRILRVVDEIIPEPTRYPQPMVYFDMDDPPADYLGETPYFLQEFANAIKPYNLTIGHCFEDFRKILFNAERYEKTLQDAEIKYVFHIAWYSFAGFALNIACHRLGIPTIDVEHGLLNLHSMYYGWMKTSPTRYALFPDYFWVWSQAIQNMLIEVNKESGLLSNDNVIVGGNWNNLKDLVSLSHANHADYEMLLMLTHNKNNVLVGVSNMDDHKFKQIKQAVIDAGKEYNWLFRFHYKDGNASKFKQRIDNELAEYNCEYELSCSLSTSEILSVADVFVSDLSTLFQEALLWGVPGVMLNPTRTSNAFAEAIHDGTILKCIPPEKLSDVIAQSLKVEKDACRKTATKYFAPPEECNKNLKVFFDTVRR